MSVQVYGCNHVAIEVDDIKAAVAFLQRHFNLEQLDRGRATPFSSSAKHQFLAMFEVKKLHPEGCDISESCRDEHQLAEVRKKITGKYKLKLQPPFRCDFHDPMGQPIQVVDLS